MREQSRHEGNAIPAEYLETLYRQHFQGALVRSGASAIMWLFASAAYLTGMIRLHHFTGVTLSVIYLILINPPTLFLLKHIRQAHLYRYASLLVNFLEILGYTAIMYSLGGIEAAYLVPIYAALIAYVSVVGPVTFPFIVAGLSSVAFGFLVMGEIFSFLPPQRVALSFDRPLPNKLMILSAVTGLLFVVAYVSSVTGGILKRNRAQLRRRNLDLLERTASLEEAQKELRKAHQELEGRVEERTRELKEANNRLKDQITERKRAEEELLESEGKYRDLYENAPVGYVELDNEGHIKRVNRRELEMLGYPEEEMLGHPVWNFVVEEEQAEAFIKAKLAGTHPPSEGLERLYRRKDGTTVWVLIDDTVVRDNDGRIWGIRSTMQDITERRRAEEALQESEEFLRTIVDNIPDMIFVKDAKELRFVRFNKAGEELLGYAREGLIGKCDYDFFPKEEADFFTRRDRDVLSSGEYLDIPEERIQTRHGGKRVLHTKKIAISDKRGKARYLLGISEDITERKRVEDELQANRLKLADAADIARIVYWEYDETSGEFVFNDAFYSLFGTTAENEGGYRMTRKEYIARFVHPDDQERLMQEIEKNRNYLLSDRLAQYEHRAVRRDGKVMHIVAQTRFVVDQDGRFIKAIGVSQDITARKEMENALRASEARYRAVIENSYDGMIFLDANGTIFYQTPSYSRINGYAPEERTGTSGFELIHPDDVDEIRRRWNEELRTPGAHATAKYRLRHKNGTWIWVETTAHNLLNNPDIQAIVITARDVTERKRAEEEKRRLEAQLQQAQKMESVGRLAGGVAHDFNNMLGIIIGNTELAMLKVNPSDPLSKNLQEILKASHRSSDLVRQLLAFARKQTVSPKVLDLNDTVSGMLKMLTRLIGEDIHLAWMPGHDLWHVKTDPSQIDQILANLAVNARDAIAGIGKITIETQNAALDEAYCTDQPGFEPGQYVLLAVSDTGVGMDKEVLEHLFEPFFTTKELGKGTGLGLSSVYGAVKQNGGFIDVYSEPGKGTTFKIYLPRFDATDVAMRREVQPEPLQRGTETVLMVEDEAPILETGKAALERLGYKVLTANTPHEAIRLAGEAAEAIHLLFTDVVMPGMNGKELEGRIKAIHPSLKCLYMSGYTANAIAHHGVLDEGVHFIHKPFTMKELAAKVREALGKA